MPGHADRLWMRRALVTSSAAAVLAAPFAALAAPVLVLDNFAGGASQSNRVAGDAPGSLFRVGPQDVKLNYIAVLVDLNSAGNFKFIVMRHSDHAIQYISPAKNFADDGNAWKMSNQFDFTLKANTDYDIGAISDVAGLWAFDTVAAAGGGLSTLVQNPNFSNYAAPTNVGHGGGDAAVRVYKESAQCGNGVVEGMEQCDDGNASNTDACLSTCAPASCGDGFVQAGVEPCDDGNASNNDACLTTCKLAACGDGFVFTGAEECDDGNGDDADMCLSTCKVFKCGDGFVGPGESCDDGNTVDDDACSNACVAASCGDGVKQAAEGCDDGNTVDDDACTNACTTPVCGDSIVQSGEQCDDGNTDPGDACLDTCAEAVCGDGVIQVGVEACDDGNDVIDDDCTNACALPSCGDGVLQASEACDDGNTVDDDDCSNTCAPNVDATTGETTGDDESTGEPSTGDAPTGSGSQSGTGGEQPTTGGETTEIDDTAAPPPTTLPTGFSATDSGADDGDGCGCDARRQPTGALAWLLALAFVRRRRTAA